MTAREAAAALQVSYRDLRKIAACGLLDGQSIGAAIAYPAAAVREMAAREPITLPSTENAIAVRLSAPTPAGDEEDREWMGWHQTWPDTRKRDAVRGWWRIAPEHRDPGTALIAIVGPIVVGVWAIDHVDDRAPGGAIRLAISNATEVQQALFANRFLRLGPGPVATPI